MADVVTPAKRSQMMSGIKGKDTKPEMIVRRLLHNSGFRYRLHDKKLPGKPDLVLPRYKTVIFINGCFWHGHKSCHLFRQPKTRVEFWTTKIEANQERDHRNYLALRENGWNVIVIWECATTKKNKLPLADLKDAIINAFKANEGFLEVRGNK